MKRAARSGIGRDIQMTFVTMICALLFATGAYGQGGGPQKSTIPCKVNYLRLRIATGGDDLRGWDGMSSSKDNLNVTVDFGAQGSQLASNVNNNAEWANNSVHLVEIKFNQPVPLNNIRGIELQHTGSNLSIDGAEASTPAGPAAGIQTADNWNMQWLELMAFGGSGQALILQYGAHRFTGSDRTLRLPADIPANSCEVSERFGRLNPASKTVQNVSGTGSKYGKQQPAHSTIQPAPNASAQQLQNNRLIQQAMAHTVQVGPRANAPGGDGGYSTLIGLLHKQSAAAHSLLLPASPVSRSQTANNNGSTLLNGGSKVALNSQPYPPKSSQPMLGATQTMSAPGNSSGVATPATSASSGTTANFNLMPGAAANSPTPTNGPTAHQPPSGHQQTTQLIGAQAPMTTQICKAGIGTVDGGAGGVWFSPVAGRDGQFVIRGCGFGSAPGEVYLSGVQYDPANAKGVVQHLGSLNSPDRVYFQTPPNNWSDRQIIAQIDANASGLYDTNNVTLNVKTASGQVYQAIEMNFLAARADQPLNWIVPPPSEYSSFVSQASSVSSPTAVVQLTAVADSSGNQMVAAFESPSASTTWQNETVDVIRAKLGESTPSKVTFPGGTDTYQLKLAPGFQLDPQIGVVMRHTQIDVTQCQTSYNGEYNTNGNWAVNYTSEKSFQISWQEESCWPKAGTQGVSPLDYGSVSAYALEVTILGPRGTSPWASGKVNPLAIKQIQPVQMLPKN